MEGRHVERKHRDRAWGPASRSAGLGGRWWVGVGIAVGGELASARAKLAADLEIKVTGYVNAGRESALVEALRAKMPGASLRMSAALARGTRDNSPSLRLKSEAPRDGVSRLPTTPRSRW